MKKILLDTHTLLWYFQNNKQLNSTVIDLLENLKTQILHLRFKPLVKVGKRQEARGKSMKN